VTTDADMNAIVETRTDAAELSRNYYRAHERTDRAAIEARLAEDFTFTSPLDIASTA
jgi:ketosteroid isomerase-like protein